MNRTLRLLLGLLFCLSSPWAAADAPTAAPEPVRIRVGMDLWPGYYPVVIAKQLGLFAKRGLDVDYFVPENTGKMLDDFAAGTVDVVCVAMGDAITLKTRAPSLKVVMISDESAGGDALLALKPLPASLKGMRIGTNLDGFGELFVRAFLKQHATPLDQVQLVQMDAALAAAALTEGKVDIAHSWEPYVSDATAYEQAEVVFTSAQTPGLIPDAVVMHGNLLNKPEAAKAFVAAWLEAAEWWLANRHAGDRLAERALAQMPNTVRLEGIRLFDRAANRQAFRPGDSLQSLPFAAETYLDYYRSKGKVPDSLRAEDLLDGSLLPAAAQ